MAKLSPSKPYIRPTSPTKTKPRMLYILEAKDTRNWEDCRVHTWACCDSSMGATIRIVVQETRTALVQEIDACFLKQQFLTVLNFRQSGSPSRQYLVAQPNSEIITPSLGFPVPDELIQTFRHAPVKSIADAMKSANGTRLSVTGLLTSIRQPQSGLLTIAVLQDESTDAEIKIKLWGDKMTLVNDDLIQTTLTIQNLCVSEYRELKELTSTPSTARAVQKQENKSGVVQAINSDKIVISNAVYQLKGYHPENVRLGDQIEYTVQESTIISVKKTTPV